MSIYYKNLGIYYPDLNKNNIMDGVNLRMAFTDILKQHNLEFVRTGISDTDSRHGNVIVQNAIGHWHHDMYYKRKNNFLIGLWSNSYSTQLMNELTGETIIPPPASLIVFDNNIFCHRSIALTKQDDEYSYQYPTRLFYRFWNLKEIYADSTSTKRLDSKCDDKPSKKNQEQE